MAGYIFTSAVVPYGSRNSSNGKSLPYPSMFSENLIWSRVSTLYTRLCAYKNSIKARRITRNVCQRRIGANYIELIITASRKAARTHAYVRLAKDARK